VKAIADTGFLVAFGNRRDHHHQWAVEIAERVTEPLLTCKAVLAETAFHLGSSPLALAFVRDGLVKTAFAAGEHTASALSGGHNRPIGFSCVPPRQARSDPSNSSA
jgi:predicted nucleic acid-binding protein